MTTVEPKYRRPLNSEQRKVLVFLYRVRFSTNKQIATYLGKTSHKTIQDKLRRLEDQGFIGKRYETSYKLAGRAAEYFLTPKGSRQLSADDEIDNERAMKALYRNKTVSPEFIFRSVRLVDIIFTLKATYPDNLFIATRNDLLRYTSFPSWTPDLFLRFNDIDSPDRAEYVLDVWDGSQPFFVSVRKVRTYINYTLSYDWMESLGEKPIALIICPDEKMQRKLNKQIRRALNDHDAHNAISFATITKYQLEAPKGSSPLWSLVDEFDDEATLRL